MNWRSGLNKLLLVVFSIPTVALVTAILFWLFGVFCTTMFVKLSVVFSLVLAAVLVGTLVYKYSGKHKLFKVGIISVICFILITFFLASLNSSSRNKGPNAWVMAGLNSLRAQAELYFDDNSGSYLGVCGSKEFMDFKVDYINKPHVNKECNGKFWSVILPKEEKETVSEFKEIDCKDDEANYVIFAKLPDKWGYESDKDSLFWCVDSSGQAKTYETKPNVNLLSCE